MKTGKVHGSNDIVTYFGQDFINVLLVNAEKTARFYAKTLVFPEEVNGENGFVGWSCKKLPVKVIGFRCLDLCSAEYIDTYWNVECDEREGSEFHSKHDPFIVGISYDVRDLTKPNSYRLWKIA